jgi:hypothetical protein
MRSESSQIYAPETLKPSSLGGAASYFSGAEWTKQDPMELVVIAAVASPNSGRESP